MNNMNLRANYRALAFWGVAATVVAACSQNAIMHSEPAPSACPAIAEAPPTLYSPAPGATGVPIAVGDMIVGPPVDGTFSLVPAGASPISLVAASMIPSPGPSSLPTGETYYAVPLPTLSPNITYGVTYTVPKTSGCQFETGGTLGSFTTL